MKTLSKVVSLTIEEFGDLRLMTLPNKRQFVLHKKDMPKKLDDLWNFKDWSRTCLFMSDEYMANYFEGQWDSRSEIDIRQAIIDGKTPYRNGLDEGLLYHLDGQPVVRKVHCDFWSTYYPDIHGLKTVLEKHGQWHNIEIVRQTLGLNVSITGREYLKAKYLPTQK